MTPAENHGRLEFPIAPMSTPTRRMTLALFSLPLFFLMMALVSAAMLFMVALFVAVYAFVWCYMRPRRFVLTADSLRIEWPFRARSIPRSAISRVQILDGAAFRREHGWGLRYGAGGLWGGFGLLKTHETTFSMYISTDNYVVVHLGDARPLLITPTNPPVFLAACLYPPKPDPPSSESEPRTA